ncbi:MAG: hypothetical protein KF867_06565, partial [Cryobacterium sp.]|nr:hypothetical protein [Cryobacterium sp.]
LPAAIMRYRATNRTDAPVEVTIAGSMTNPVGITGYNVFHFPDFKGNPSNTWFEEDALRGVVYSTDLSTDDLLYGSAVLATTDPEATAKPQWLSGYWQDGVQVFWNEFVPSGKLNPEERFSIDQPPYAEWFTKLRVGSVAVQRKLAPGESAQFEFLIAWHFPNRPRAWLGNINLDNSGADQIIRNHYATLYPDARSVARQLIKELPALETSTRAFHESLFGSSLPHEIIDAASANLTVIRSTTCFRLEGGVFAAWEGSFDHSGSCEGTCTHVWNYAQSIAWLFPELERSARRTEFLHEVREDGRMNFRANSVFGNSPWDFHAAVDGQLGAVVRLYREWRFSGDKALVQECWPGVKRVIGYACEHWDSNGDAVLDSEQHNTYDIEFHGENSLANSMFFAALLAAAELAELVGEPETATFYRDSARDGSVRMDDLLYNGEYYVQRIADVDARRYQYGTGCLSDQVFGQTLAHLVGLGHILPAEHVRSSIRSVYRYNFRRDLADQQSVQRTYALNREAGLVLCSWPEGSRPAIPFVYSDEVWTGIEYQVATHLIYEGFVEEGLEIVRSVRARHNGTTRSPWNEVECGNHYARSLASWGCLLAFSGAQWDAAKYRLSFQPATTTPLNTFFSTGTGWGSISIDSNGARITVRGGRVSLRTLAVAGRTLKPTDGRDAGRSLEIEAGHSIQFSYQKPQEEQQ